MDVSEAKRLKGLEDEDARLKRLLAVAMLNNATLKDLLGKEVVTLAGKRQAVAHLVEGHGMSNAVARQAIAKQSAERGRASRAIGCCRMTMRHEILRQDDKVLRERLKEQPGVRRRFGYRRLIVFLRREGHEVSASPVPSGDVGTEQALFHQPECDILRHGQIWEKGVVLQDRIHRTLKGWQVINLRPVDQDTACADVVEHSDESQKCCFAAARGG